LAFCRAKLPAKNMLASRLVYPNSGNGMSLAEVDTGLSLF